MIALDSLRIAASALFLPHGPEEPPFAWIDLDAEAGRGAEAKPILPPRPIIGVGDRTHPLARWLDAVVEPPITLDRLARSILANPIAAGICVQLLRSIDRQSVADALLAESLGYGVLQAGAEHRRWLAGRDPPPAAAPGELRVERGGSELVLTLARPEAGNAIDRTLRDALRETFDAAALDSSLARIVLRGEGKAFCLGGDLAEFGTSTDPAKAHAIRMRTLPAHGIARVAHLLWVRVDGACVGAGVEMAAFAVHVAATPRAWFQLPELAMGLIPGAGGCVSLPRRIGRQRAALLMLSGRRIGARTALEWGLIDAIERD